MRKGIRVYNLYPKLVGSMEKWITHFDRIKKMNFDWIYVNPINAPGFSGSDYAIKDYYGYHPLFVTGEYNFDKIEEEKPLGNELLKKVCTEANNHGLNVMFDLVINHTAVDSHLTKDHPNWYLKNEDGSIKNPGTLDGTNYITWGDLAQIDNENSLDKDNLWEYWLDMTLFYCGLGVRGFRCDAAYHVPTSLWKFLIQNVKNRYPDTIFLAETLGDQCTPKILAEVADSGFDYVMSSFKWWDLKSDWFLKDYSTWAGKYPSLSFPENHDTIRYSTEINGNKNMAINKYALCAYFSSSIATTIGYEYGFKRKIDVVQTNPTWWEEPSYDISEDIAKINEIKSKYDVLLEDNMINLVNFNNNNIVGFTKYNLGGTEKVLVISNGNQYNSEVAKINGIYGLMGGSNVIDISHGYRMDNVPDNLEYNLNPGEVKLFYLKK
ncbi:MAG: hypothetical protein GX287_06510 [Fusobacteria bacterium]|jgi:hypothetical protein|nr:hypothetical protein [Fusobacteriota bacterium]